jgi:putative endopeptidase
LSLPGRGRPHVASPGGALVAVFAAAIRSTTPKSIWSCPVSKALRFALAAALPLAITACSPASDVAAPAPAAAAPLPERVDISGVSTPLNRFSAADRDPDVAACRDFNRHVNGRWLAANPVPADQTSWGSFELLRERSLEVQHAIARAASAGPADAGSIERRVGDFFRAGMDEAGIEAAGLGPLAEALAGIDALDSAESFVAHLQHGQASGDAPLFRLFAAPDLADSTVNIAFVGQGGLTLPERAYYLEDREDYLAARQALTTHAARLLVLAGASGTQAAADADAILAFETELAQASMGRLELRDPANRYNPVSVVEADALTPRYAWSAQFEAIGVPAPERFSLGQPGFFQAIDRMLAETPAETWRAWLRFRLLDEAAPYLGKDFVQAHFAFHDQALRGREAMPERWKRVLDELNGAMGEALGQLYVAVAFPPESKAKMERLVANLSEALRERLQGLEWMGEETRVRAVEKWASFTAKIGYPERWRDWDGLQIAPEGYLANAQAARAFNTRWNLGKIGKPVDRSEWGMSPQTVNAYYRASANEIVFPAAILQPPFFDPAADDALNYGGIGAVIGHEMLHGYDDQGSKFDAAGNFANWWTEEDRQRFEARTARLVAQFDAYEALPGLFVNGRLGLGENIADLGGLTVAYAAMRRAQGEDFVDPMIEGMSQSQRFFANWATVWRRGFTEASLRLALSTGPHAPAPFRALGAPSNMDAFARAYGCSAEDPMVRTGEERVEIW